MKRQTVLPTMQFVPAVSPRFRPPLHLSPLVEALERSEREPVHAVISVPPRHMKTETVKHYIVRRLRMSRRTRIAYVTYAAAYALKKSRETRQLFARAGGTVVDEANRLGDWRTTNDGADDGGLWATSIGGPITGEGFDLIIIDDAVKSRALAESGIEREKLIDWHRDTLSTREEPEASVFVIGARWTPYDLAGTLIADGYEHINLPAISDDGRALCPDRYPLTALERIRERLGPYGWSSLYMGTPYPRGGALFSGTYFYDALPPALRIRVGVDFAYTSKTKADYSVAVALGESGGVYHVVDALRLQVTAPEFRAALDAFCSRYPGVRPFAFVGGQEKGVVDLMNSQGGLRIDTAPATIDKFLRAQPAAAAWNVGKVLLPRSAPWLDAFVTELISFTGNDAHDDQVDALAGAFHASARLARIGAQASSGLPSFVRRPNIDHMSLGYGDSPYSALTPGRDLSRLIITSGRH
jgi:predicted phage terminase large subunit-like protein